MIFGRRALAGLVEGPLHVSPKLLSKYFVHVLSHVSSSYLASHGRAHNNSGMTRAEQEHSRRRGVRAGIARAPVRRFWRWI